MSKGPGGLLLAIQRENKSLFISWLIILKYEIRLPRETFLSVLFPLPTINLLMNQTFSSVQMFITENHT